MAMGTPGLKRIVARFYRTAAGNEPVKDWLRSLEREDRKTIGKDIAEVEFGWPVGKPLSAPIGNKGLREVRSTIKRGKVEARVYFGIDGSIMILLHGHEKKPSQQGDEIATAEKRWGEYQRRRQR